jgi:hypothetical protein
MGRTSSGVLAVSLPVLLVLGSFSPAAAQTLAPTSSTAGTSVTPTTTAARAALPTICATQARRGFWPTKSRVQRVQKRVPVLAVGRNRYGVPNTPPLSSLGKRSFGWDKKGPKPGSRRGNVRFNAHTYPDGSALGNRMLNNLWPGQIIIVKNSYGKAICYQVTKRITVRPRNSAALATFYSTTGRPKLAIAVCSGTRLGPGNWTHRTLWYALPVTG